MSAPASRPPGPIRDDENLGRRVSDTPDDRRGYHKRLRENQGVVSHHIFKPSRKSRTSAGNFCVSVDRLDEAESPGESALVADRDAKNVGEIFHGWAVISVADARRDGRMIRPSPLDTNPHHADIILPDGPGEKDTRRMHALLLAAKAVWRPRPIG